MSESQNKRTNNDIIAGVEALIAAIGNAQFAMIDKLSGQPYRACESALQILEEALATAPALLEWLRGMAFTLTAIHNAYGKAGKPVHPPAPPMWRNVYWMNLYRNRKVKIMRITQR